MPRNPDPVSDLATFNRRLIQCDRCPRLVRWRQDVAKDNSYWSRPVPSFGDPQASLIILGLAPGAHGANRTGRPFTGDSAGQLLYRALFDAGAGSDPESLGQDDGLSLEGVMISNAVRCVPPKNRVTRDELAACTPWLDEELSILNRVRTVLALGKVAHDQILRYFKGKGAIKALRDHPFGHEAIHELPGDLPVLVDSFHPSRYNVNVGKLTYEMFLTAVSAALRLSRQ